MLTNIMGIGLLFFGSSTCVDPNHENFQELILYISKIVYGNKFDKELVERSELRNVLKSTYTIEATHRLVRKGIK